MAASPPIRLLSLQYGDYRESWNRKCSGLGETYRGQYRSMDAFAGFSEGGALLVICVDTEPYDVTYGHQRFVGGRFAPSTSGLRYHWDAWRAAGRMRRIVAPFRPTHALLRTPGWVSMHMGPWLLRRGCHVLPAYSDYFHPAGLVPRLMLRRLVQFLNRPEVLVVANHHHPASESMVRAGVDPAKVVPTDLERQNNPADLPPRTRAEGTPLRALFVGNIVAAKGVFDAVEAAKLAISRGVDLTLEIVGAGTHEPALRAALAEQGASGRIVYLGRLTNEEVRRRMAAAHAVLVTSHHGFPDAMPFVIVEALEARTPVVASDHPAFSPLLRDGPGCLVFPAGDVAALAACLGRLAREPGLFDRLSAGTVPLWESLRCPTTHEQLITEWLAATVTGAPIPSLQRSLALAPGRAASGEPAAR